MEQVSRSELEMKNVGKLVAERLSRSLLDPMRVSSDGKGRRMPPEEANRQPASVELEESYPAPRIPRDGADGVSYLRDTGFRHAGRALANPSSLVTSLRELYGSYIGEEDPNRGEYLATIIELKRKCQVFDARAKEIRNALQGLTDRIHSDSDVGDLTARINTLHAEISALEAGPRKPAHGGPDFDIATFLASGSLILALSVYLFIFYTSASHVAFFRELGTGLESKNFQVGDLRWIFGSIFDRDALSEAVRTGNLFVLTFPVIFLSLGFVIHKLYEEKQWLVLTLFMAVTFSFDGLLAYQIASKLHNVKYLAGLVDYGWNTGVAITDVNLWTIILAGFVVYIIWTFVLSIWMREFKHRNPFRLEVAARKRESQGLRERIAQHQDALRNQKSDLEKRLTELSECVRSSELEIGRYEKMLSMRIIRWRELERRIEAFTRGWLDYVVQSQQSPGEVEERTSHARRLVDGFKAEILAGFQSGGSIEVLSHD